MIIVCLPFSIVEDAGNPALLGFGSVRPAPLMDGIEIHERHPLFDPVERQRAGCFVAIVGQCEDHAVASERLEAVPEHEEVLRAVEKPFFIDVTMVIVIETDRFDQSADNLLQNLERTVDFGFGDHVVLGIDDDRAHEGLRKRVRDKPGRSLFRSPVHPFPAGLSLLNNGGDSG
jgi:hypothetical protein